MGLQGGGAHGAFTWGVLERLLEEDSIEIAGISGTSAGALNGAALKAGLIKGGRQGAIENLEWLWSKIGSITDLRLASWMTAFAPSPALVSQGLESSLFFNMADAATRVFSPYHYGPFYKNPLSDIVEEFEYDSVCAASAPHFFVGATNVRTGKIRVFQEHEINTDVILASACLPTLFQAVEIDGEAYWDGGYTGNPALFPLFEPELPADIVVININPLNRGEIPTSPTEILNRINEIGFNSSLLRELRAINFVKRLIDEGSIAEGAMKDVNIHMIADDALMNDLSVATKLVPTASVILQLRAAGREAADSFIQKHSVDIGKRSSVDLSAMYD